MARRAPKQFFLFLVDRDQKMFNVVGPMTDDSEWIDLIRALQQQGREVNCFSAPSAAQGEIDTYARQQRLRYSTSPLFQAPPPKADAPKGPIPQYAAGADPSRLVNLLCKKECGKLRWAEMVQPFPGLDVLKAAQVGAFTARCLKCGGIAQDPYNWTR